MDISKGKIDIYSDAELIDKVLNGEIALFEVLIRRYNPVLYKLARTYGFTHQDAEDLMQDSHYAAYTKLHTFRGLSSYKTWLCKILLNNCYHKQNFGYMKYEEKSGSVTGGSIESKAYNSEDTEQIIMNKELGKLLEESLQKIPLIYRSVFMLRETEGYSVNETANLLDITEVNVKVRLNRAKALLQKLLEKYYSRTDIYEFNLVYCDAIVDRVYKRISSFINKT